MIRLLGIDPGFRHLGWCLADYNHGEMRLHVQRMGVIRTEKDKRKVLASVDNVKRGSQIFNELRPIANDYLVQAMCVESMSFPPNASTAAKMAMSWGIVIAIKELMGLALLQRSPQDIKMAVAGSKKASKAEMEAILAGKYPDALTAMQSVPLSLWEHGFDALGAVLACLDDDLIKMEARRT